MPTALLDFVAVVIGVTTVTVGLCLAARLLIFGLDRLALLFQR